MTGGPLNLYDVTIGNNTTQMRLNDTDAAFFAEHYTAKLVEGGEAAVVDAAGGDKPGAKRRTTANKLGGAENK